MTALQGISRGSFGIDNTVRGNPRRMNCKDVNMGVASASL